MEKSWVTRAHSMAPAAISAPSRTMKTNWRPVAMSRPSRRWIPTPRVTTPRAAAMNPRVTPPNPIAPFTAPIPSGRLSLRGVHRRRVVLGAVLDHDPVGVERRPLPVALADDGDAVLEQLRRVTVVDDRRLLRPVGHLEAHAVGDPGHRTRHHRTHEAEAVVALRRTVPDGLGDGLEVDDVAAEPADDQIAHRRQAQAAGHPVAQPPRLPDRRGRWGR